MLSEGVPPPLGCREVTSHAGFMGLTGGARLPEGAAPGGIHSAIRVPGRSLHAP